MWLKICGMNSPEAIAAALAAGADAIGFVFAPSVRTVTPAQAARLAASVRGRVECIAVTLHPQQGLIDEILRLFKPDALQSDIEDFERVLLPDSLPRLPVLRAGAGVEAAPRAMAQAGLPHRWLFEGERSGSGATADWQQASRLARTMNLVLAGGLTARNVAAAISAVRPYGLDVSSGVESAPGLKSPERIAEFVQAARAAFHETAHDLT